MALIKENLFLVTRKINRGRQDAQISWLYYRQDLLKG